MLEEEAPLPQEDKVETVEEILDEGDPDAAPKRRKRSTRAEAAAKALTSSQRRVSLVWALSLNI